MLQLVPVTDLDSDLRHLSRSVLFAKGASLASLGSFLGVKRRFFGLEPDVLLRKRVVASLTDLGMLSRGLL